MSKSTSTTATSTTATNTTAAASAFDPIAQPFVEGLAQDELRYQRCSDCGAAQKLARYACRACGSARLEWHRSCGSGTVFATTVVSRPPAESYLPLVPYTLVLVDLDEGARLMAHAEPGVAIGERVAAGFFDHDGQRMIRFRRQQDVVFTAARVAHARHGQL